MAVVPAVWELALASEPAGRQWPPAGHEESDGVTAMDIPDGIEIESVYLVEVPYTPEAPQRRPAVRPAHLARLARLIEEGVLVEAGGCADWSKAVLVVRAPSAAAAIALIDEDVYTTAGVWTSPRATSFGRVRLEPPRSAGTPSGGDPPR